MRAAILGILLSSAASMAASEVIERACLTSGRASNRALCGCIQDAANMTLDRKDQKLAASFFKDPNRAQEIRQSGRRVHETFWERYRVFGETAQAFCDS